MTCKTQRLRLEIDSGGAKVLETQLVKGVALTTITTATSSA